MRTFVIIPTIGRAQCVCDTVKWLERQTLRPDGVVVIGVNPEDVDGVEAASDLPVEALLWDIGSSAQRNRGLHHIYGRADFALFLDDDFIPVPSYLEDMVKLFEARPDIAGMTGRMIEDGIHGTGIAFADAVALAEQDVAAEVPSLEPRQGLYGCNMAIRLEAAKGIRFDERLKLYGWQEDIDFSYQIGKRGLLVKYDKLAGVHMGIKRGRTSGRRFGYSQIANPVYLLKKRTIPQSRAYKIMSRNFASNLVRSFRPEAHIDRHGRLAGNLLAIGDLLLGRLRPERIVDL